MEDRGLEPSGVSTEKTAHSETGGAESGAVGARDNKNDAGLDTVIRAWPQLAEDLQSVILKLIATGRGR